MITVVPLKQPLFAPPKGPVFRNGRDCFSTGRVVIGLRHTPVRSFTQTQDEDKLQATVLSNPVRFQLAQEMVLSEHDSPRTGR